MIIIKHIEKEMIFLAMLQVFAKSVGHTLQDFIDEEIDYESVVKLSETLKIMENPEATHEAYKYLANDVYGRVKKKFLKN